VSTAPVRALVYLEGPPVGIDILASCFSIAPSKPEPVSSATSMPFTVSRCTLFHLGMGSQFLQGIYQEVSDLLVDCYH